MKKNLLFTLILITSYSFSQVLTFTDENGVDISNTTVTVDMLSSTITSDEEYEAVFHCYINNTTSSDMSVTFTRESNDIPENTYSYFCTLGSCNGPDDNSKSGTLNANSSSITTLYYAPIGILNDASVSYKLSSGFNEITLVVQYHVTDDTGIKNNTTDNTFLAYPNPANSKVTVSFNTNEDAEIIFYNIVGEQVKKISVNAGVSNIEIETSDLPAGTYFYSMVSNNNVTKTKRLVIKH